MFARASIEPLEWENRFFGVNSAILRFGDDAPPLTVQALAGWSRVQAKVAADDTARLDALQALGFRLVEGEVDLALPPAASDDIGAEPATEADIPGCANWRRWPLRRAVFAPPLVHRRCQRSFLCPVD